MLHVPHFVFIPLMPQTLAVTLWIEGRVFSAQHGKVLGEFPTFGQQH